MSGLNWNMSSALQAEINSKKSQLAEHLDRFLIRNANIKGITSSRLLCLESFGIETARDVRRLKKQKVPGIGPVLSKRLFDWRAHLKATFVPQKALPDSERSRVASQFAPVLLPLQETAKAAIRDLEAITAMHGSRERDLVKAIEVAVRNVAVEEAHLGALNRLP